MTVIPFLGKPKGYTCKHSLNILTYIVTCMYYSSSYCDILFCVIYFLHVQTVEVIVTAIGVLLEFRIPRRQRIVAAITETVTNDF